MNHSRIKPLYTFFFLAIIVSTVIKVIAVGNHTFPLTYDQGRDLTDMRQMLFTKTPRLIGPTTSINGLHLGPFYYYLLFPVFVLSGGDPHALLIFQIMLYQFSVVLFYFVLRKDHPSLSLIASSLLLLLPTGFYTGRYFWNANTMPIFTLLTITTFISYHQKKTSFRAFLSGIVVGLSLQIEAAFAILLIPLALLTLLHQRATIKHYLLSILGFSLTLLPQFVFELRHGFLMTRILFDEFGGKSAILGQSLPLAERFSDRILLFSSEFRNLSHIPYEILLPVIFALLVFFLVSKSKVKKYNCLFMVSLALLVIAFIFYLLFPLEVKRWYILSLSVPFALVFSALLDFCYRRQFAQKMLVIFLLCFTFFHTLKAQIEFIQSKSKQADENPSSLVNELKATDWIFRQANGNSFRVYSYLPAVYDYQFQHLFWWYGTKTYGYQPEDIAYLPNQPVYIKDGEKAWTKRKSGKDSDIFLILQTSDLADQKIKNYIANFRQFCETNQTKIQDSLYVKHLVFCESP